MFELDRGSSQVEGFARACTYDRAWLGWSDPAPIAAYHLDYLDDLHAAARSGADSQAHILVGHSFGGMLACAYAAKYPAMSQVWSWWTRFRRANG